VHNQVNDNKKEVLSGKFPNAISTHPGDVERVSMMHREKKKNWEYSRIWS
jgi:hypothetical protein